MTLTLDPATEERITQRIQREIDLGHSRDAAEVITRALNLLEAQEDWLLENRDTINQRLEESLAQSERGELYTPEEAHHFLDERQAERLTT